MTSLSAQTSDTTLMRNCLDEARKGLGFTSPNPMVGAIITRDQQIIATGWHKQDGGAHAEVEALSSLEKGAAQGSTLYVNLEPCCHHGRTPPCVDAVITAGISRVVIANLDPDPRVAGQGVARLRAAGIQVETGVLEAEGRALNSIYFHYKEQQRPYIVLKAALTLDGKIATQRGDSKWISNEDCRTIAHKLRRRIKAIAIGKNTLFTDTPKLDCRLPGFEKKPIDRLIFSSNEDDSLRKQMEKCFDHRPGRLFVIDKTLSASKETFLNFCSKSSIDSILVEGGGRLAAWFLNAQLVDRVILFYKPSFLGNNGASIFESAGPDRIAALEEFRPIEVRMIGNNVMLELTRGEPLCLLD